MDSQLPRQTDYRVITNERAFIRTIVKWSKTAAILAVVAVLLVAYVFVQKVYAQPLADVSHSLNQSQQETSKIKSNLESVKTEKTTLVKEVETKDAKILQLEQENASLK